MKSLTETVLKFLSLGDPTPKTEDTILPSLDATLSYLRKTATSRKDTEFKTRKTSSYTSKGKDAWQEVFVGKQSGKPILRVLTAKDFSGGEVWALESGNPIQEVSSVIIHNTDKFRVDSIGNGMAYRFVNKAELKDIFFQAESDVKEFERAIEDGENAGWSYNQIFSELWNQYGDLAQDTKLAKDQDEAIDRGVSDQAMTLSDVEKAIEKAFIGKKKEEEKVKTEAKTVKLRVKAINPAKDLKGVNKNLGKTAPVKGGKNEAKKSRKLTLFKGDTKFSKLTPVKETLVQDPKEPWIFVDTDPVEGHPSIFPYVRFDSLESATTGLYKTADGKYDGEEVDSASIRSETFEPIAPLADLGIALDEINSYTVEEFPFVELKSEEEFKELVAAATKVKDPGEWKEAGVYDMRDLTYHSSVEEYESSSMEFMADQILDFTFQGDEWEEVANQLDKGGEEETEKSSDSEAGLGKGEAMKKPSVVLLCGHCLYRDFEENLVEHKGLCPKCGSKMMSASGETKKEDRKEESVPVRNKIKGKGPSLAKANGILKKIGHEPITQTQLDLIMSLSAQTDNPFFVAKKARITRQALMALMNVTAKDGAGATNF